MRHAARGRVLRSLTAAGLVAGVVAVVGQVVGGTVATEETSQRTVLRGLVGRGTDVSAADNPLSGLRRYRVEDVADSSYDVRLLTVEGLPRTSRYGSSPSTPTTASSGRPATTPSPTGATTCSSGSRRQVGTEQRGRPVRVDVEVLAGYRSNWLPLAGALRMLTFDFLDGRTQVEDVRYNPATSSAYVVGGLGPRDDYTFEAVLDSRTVTGGSDPYPTQRSAPAGRRVPRPAAPPVAQLRPDADGAGVLAGAVPRGERPLQQRSDARGGPVRPRPRRGTARTGVLRGAGDRRRRGAVRRVLRAGRQPAGRARPGRRGGVADRRRGRPRAGRGRLGGGPGRDGGWRRIPTRTFLGDEPVADDEPPRVPPEDYLERDEPEQEQPQEEPGSQQPTGPNVSGDDGSGRPPWSPWALAAALACVVPATKAGRRLLRHRGSAYGRALGGWRELLDTARDLGRPVAPGLTRPSQAEQLGVDPEVARQADAVAYAVDSPGDAAGSAVWDATADAGSVLVAQASWPRRVWRWWNPASLLTGTRRLLQARLTG